MPVVSPQPIEQALRLMGRSVRRSKRRVYSGIESPLRHRKKTTFHEDGAVRAPAIGRLSHRAAIGAGQQENRVALNSP